MTPADVSGCRDDHRPGSPNRNVYIRPRIGVSATRSWWALLVGLLEDGTKYKRREEVNQDSGEENLKTCQLGKELR